MSIRVWVSIVVWSIVVKRQSIPFADTAIHNENLNWICEKNYLLCCAWRQGLRAKESFNGKPKFCGPIFVHARPLY